MNPTATAPAAAILAASSAETVAAYALFRRDPVAGVPAMPTHMEFLIDRAGYLRARWIPNEQPGWREIGTLLREIDRLNREPPHPPAPEGHVHSRPCKANRRQAARRRSSTTALNRLTYGGR